MADELRRNELFEMAKIEAIEWGKSCGFDPHGDQVSQRTHTIYNTMVTPPNRAEVPSHVLDKKLDKIIELLSITP